MRKKKRKPNNKQKSRKDYKYINVLVTIHRGIYGKPVEKFLQRVREY